MNERKLILILGRALKDASAHLDYCNYGDEWERSCAKESKLPKQIMDALGEFDKWAEDKEE